MGRSSVAGLTRSRASHLHATCGIAALLLIACGKTRSLGDGTNDARNDDPNDASGGQQQVPPFAGAFRGLTGPAGLTSCSVRAISRDGTTAAGTCWSVAPGADSIGALWNVDEPSAPIQIGGGLRAGAVNGDGSVVFAGNGTTMFRWKEGQVTEIPAFTGATDASDDGSRVVGFYNGGENDYRRACTWTEEEGRLLLPVPSSDDSSWAHAISADGSVIVGQLLAHTGGTQAVRWEDGQEPELLRIPSGAGSSTADAISADGKVIGGTVRIGDVERPVRWTEDRLEWLSEKRARVVALNADGSRVLLDFEGAPYLLEPDGRLQDATELAGVDPLNGFDVWSASDDLRVIVADFERGERTNAYVLRLP